MDRVDVGYDLGDYRNKLRRNVGTRKKLELLADVVHAELLCYELRHGKREDGHRTIYCRFAYAGERNPKGVVAAHELRLGRLYLRLHSREKLYAGLLRKQIEKPCHKADGLVLVVENRIWPWREVDYDRLVGLLPFIEPRRLLERKRGHAASHAIVVLAYHPLILRQIIAYLLKGGIKLEKEVAALH